MLSIKIQSDEHFEIDSEMKQKIINSVVQYLEQNWDNTVSLEKEPGNMYSILIDM